MSMLFTQLNVSHNLTIPHVSHNPSFWSHPLMLVTNPNVTDGKETISVTDGTGYTDTLKPCNLLYKDK